MTPGDSPSRMAYEFPPFAGGELYPAIYQSAQEQQMKTLKRTSSKEKAIRDKCIEQKQLVDAVQKAEMLFGKKDMTDAEYHAAFDAFRQFMDQRDI